jgi:hypothetical protein
MKFSHTSVKSLCLTVFTIFLFQFTYSQTLKNGKSTVFGVQAGINYCRMHGEEGGLFGLDPLYGFNAGIFAEFRNDSRFSVRPTVAYSSAGNISVFNYYNEKKRLNYIDLSMLIKYKIDESFSVFIGPQFNLLTSAKSEKAYYNKSIKMDMKDRCKPNSFHAELGFSMEPPTAKFGVLLFYQQGFTPVFNNKHDGDQIKNNILTLQVEYKF